MTDTAHAQTCPLVTRHAAMLAEEERLSEALAQVARNRRGIEDLMRKVDTLRALGVEFEISPIANGSDHACLSDSAGADRPHPPARNTTPRRPTRRRARKRDWSKADISKMQQLVLSGHTWGEIAKLLGRSENACKAKAAKTADFIRPAEVLRQRSVERLTHAIDARRPEPAIGAAHAAIKAVPPPAPTCSDAETNAPLDALQASGCWSDEQDLIVVQAWHKGLNAAQAARLVRRDAQDVMLRWMTLLPEPSYAARADLLRALEQRAGIVAQAAP